MYNFKAYEPTDEIDKFSARPDAFIPCYPVVSFIEDYSHMGSRQALLRDEWENEELAMLFSNEKHINSDTPPCFLWHTATDDVVPVKNSLALAEALSANKVYFEMHIFPVGCHGLGLAKDRNDIGIWSSCACTFLKNLGF
jgi:dipeptidyl aminopeptidase/acylaminoacyl peptidase